MRPENRAVALGKWFLFWTAIGCIFSLQLRWYYELPWPTAVFWGLADWYLWGLIAAGTFVAIRSLMGRGWSLRPRIGLYVLAGPAAAALHVAMTMIVGSVSDPAIGLEWGSYFAALYAKKLTLNLLTFATIVTACEYANKRNQARGRKFLARKGDTTRLVSPEQIIWGEVCGNYINLHTANGMWPVRETLTRLINCLPERRFVKVSRSQFANIDSIRECAGGPEGLRIHLTDGSSVNVARRHVARVRQALREYCKFDESSGEFS